MEQRAGHRSVPHTADLRVEAWGPGREECLTEAVRGVVEAFADIGGAQAVRDRESTVRGERDEDLLVALLDEVVYQLDTKGEIPVEVRLNAVPGGVRALFRTADIGTVPLIGAAPKAVTLHGLAIGRGADGWSCAVTLDV
ncbi:archease [Streptomyces litchfieldiae]|uniref:Archease n=1 Tax=Streptomyces litchfieldiae TaxID=3075543 RepID=A0ABU2MSY9_9ACTN|nr:archease [Streptomyces sp. DSM 44938]MDT0344204.1 archease [Streptomyces sp. DSM 44938]